MLLLNFIDTENMQRYVKEERSVREENLRLQRKLQLEVDRRVALCRHLSESESSLEMEEERQYNEAHSRGQPLGSPAPYNRSPSSSRPLSPGRLSYFTYIYLHFFLYLYLISMNSLVKFIEIFSNYIMIKL